MKKLDYKVLGASCLITGLLFASFEIYAVIPSLSYEVNGNDLTITYTGTLYQSSDAVNWTEVKSGSSPYKTKITNKKLFFCAKGESDSRNFTIPLADGVGLDMVWIEPGTFTMGSPSDELSRSDGEVQHEVTLTQGYWLGQYEVTQAQYEAVMGDNPSWFNGADLPVEYVDWYDARFFCLRLTKLEREAGRLPKGYEYNLPTEAQWEYACRAGTTTALNNGKNLTSWFESPEMNEVGWYWYNSDSSVNEEGTTHPVGQKKPNAWGLYDMHGNVYEWCWDTYGDYPTTAVTDPTGAISGSYSVLRGGSWRERASFCRSAYRTAGVFRTASYNDKKWDRGFRVALVKTEIEIDPPVEDNITISLADDVDLELIWIEPGTFMMGSPEDELGRERIEPQHEVTLTQGYWLGKYEVTQAQYKAVMEYNPSHSRADDLPVECVSWYDAKSFCATLTKLERAAGRLSEEYEYTLPTEAQWEYACRAGTTTALNSGKNLSDKTMCPEVDEVGWYGYNSGKTTHPVGQKQPNAWGFYDMHGNVYEFCLDLYGNYPTTPVTDPTGPDGGMLYYIMRGGDWNNDAFGCRSASRNATGPSDGWTNVGFRVALAKVKAKDVPREGDDVDMVVKNKVKLELVWIEPGTFTMGSPEGEIGSWYGDETQHEVTLTQGYWMGKYEVTQEQYAAVMIFNPSGDKVSGHPVEYVSWNDAINFCVYLTYIEREAGRLPEGYEFTLPTEAQWEYACRAGTTTAFNNGTNIQTIEQIWDEPCSGLDEVGWYRYNSEYNYSFSGNKYRKHQEVGQKKPNAWGLYDMHGNVAEWCLDWYEDYLTTPVTDPTGPSTGDEVVLRGGDYFNYAYYCRSALRSTSKPNGTWNNVGFRVVLAPVK
ncbi:MAG: formylglycine-generating enzyme family protein [Verrucomicrobia bacterium]|nr:formylglycine-generating enzyme family protein [Verrucomicrobiota bacterium]MBR5737885.1 formylglycine-generating enzyme family protein [Verrucomicrobiota bacterium]